IRGAAAEPIDPETIRTVNPELVVETRSDLVRSTLRSPFGKDLISIGYGGQFHLRSADDLGAAPPDRFLQLLAPAPPRCRQRLREHPQRTLRFLVGDASMRYAGVSRLLAARPRSTQSERAPYDIRDWVAVPEG